MPMNPRMEQALAEAIRHFWRTRNRQARKQGSRTGVRDTGARAAVTGGAQMDGFTKLVSELLTENGVPRASVYCKQHVELPGWYRPEKKWDLLAVADGRLLAAIEFKSHVGSLGNNYNNRTEEAIGSAADLWAAYREGAFQPSARPWLGYLMLLEDSPASKQPVKTREPHFQVFPEFRDASYAKRYEVLMTKLVRERLYDAACLLISDAKNGARGQFRQPSPELDFRNFTSSLLARAIALTKTGE